MRALAILACLTFVAGFAAGCGDKDKALDNAAPPPGPNANSHPPTKDPGSRAGKPPVFPGPGKS